ncbi:hypothetical protein BXO88_06075 [Oribacterium sp. C9]|uniref:cellulase family glycosylhydrolase n=1 Tax=Oribacterium sp. C9 TaxID=1943579 RepID=UPI00098F2E49|nr:cellulase family glycosylhydrolase [Oribacterium sp. C9]OON86825.1 hypothetical protein BXO88_06075 [Oribacterium sp. C9]
MNKIKRFVSLILLCLIILSGIIDVQLSFASEKEVFAHPRPSVNGKLHVSGTQLVDQSGAPVILRGVSTHGLTWFKGFINDSMFKQLSTEWDCDLIRLAMYSEVYCEMPDKSLSLLLNGIDYAIANDMYVIVDWHILNDGDPNIHIDKAAPFFELVSSKYPDCPNIIYEICNEPNGDTMWSDIYTYADQIIPVIRKNSPDSVILVGTPEYSRDLISAVRKQLPYENLMYVLHFYAGSHKRDLQDEISEAHDRGLPIFVSECGISESSGDGELDFESAAVWFDLLQDKGISYVIWSLSNKAESSALFSPSYEPDVPFTDSDLSDTGSWIKSLIQGQSPDSIPVIRTENKTFLPHWLSLSLTPRDILVLNSWPVRALHVFLFLTIFTALYALYRKNSYKKYPTYESVSVAPGEKPEGLFGSIHSVIKFVILFVSLFFILMYIYWRATYSLPLKYGILPVAANLILLFIEILGLIESLVLYLHIMYSKPHPLPEIKDNEFPEVDIFIATYNEPTDLLERTINGCKHLKYPDTSKVHIWVCDDNRRPEMRALAEKMEVGYFDRPDNKGAKAGNLNHALVLTHSPYIATIDADMIVKSDFLLKTIPYFVDLEKKNALRPENERAPLGLLQTPQCFYEPDIFQFALYSENNAPNEQDFFYRTIEVAKTSSNSVIYGGSNTVLSRKALETIGGFYTKTITEDFATGLLIESNGFVSLALHEPLASGKTPDTFKEHIKQRIRWGRGVISTARQLHIFRRKGLSFDQKMSYWGSVVYWYSPIKSLIYILAPLLFAVLALPVFICSWADLIIFWLPMFIMQEICLRVFSRNAVSLKWSGIYETSIMPYMLVPIVKEFFGITTKKFAVTDKSKKIIRRKFDLKTVWPFLVLIALSIIGILRSLIYIGGMRSIGLLILMFWLIRNMYFLILSLFLADGRNGDNDSVRVVDAEMITMRSLREDATICEGITTELTEHSIRLFLDEIPDIPIGTPVNIVVNNLDTQADINGVVTGIRNSKRGASCVYSVEILDYKDSRNEYLQILYDRVPTLPQSLQKDHGIIFHLLKNIAQRILNQA